MRTITVSDYIVELLIANDITDVFGYQGGMIAYVFDSLGRYKDRINYHECATEQGAAIAAVAYAQASGKFGVAISTSGPGFTNMLTGIADAWFDSIPVLYISGNVNTKDKKRDSSFRQNGFQEIQAAQMAKPITKKSIELELGMDYVKVFDEAIKEATEYRMGPVYIDLPINICREIIELEDVKPIKLRNNYEKQIEVKEYIDKLTASRKPIIIAGGGIKQAKMLDEFRELIEILDIPVVTTYPGIDVLPSNSKNMIGYIGGTGKREAGLVLQNADFVLSLGTRLCSKQVGHNMDLFAPKAKNFIRVDIDKTEFERRLKDIEIDLEVSLNEFINKTISYLKEIKYSCRHSNWTNNCKQICDLLKDIEVAGGNKMFEIITNVLSNDSNIVLDVGKNMTYGVQSSVIKDKTKMFMSAGLGTMGYAIPGGIGAYYGNHHPTYIFTGDGGAQMNIQELNTIAKNNLPVKIIVLNNKALGNIRIFQDSYLDHRYVATSEKEGDYFSCDFVAIAKAYNIKGIRISDYTKIDDYKDYLISDEPVLLEIVYEDGPVYSGIVAGGDFLQETNGVTKELVDKIKSLLD